MESKITIEFLKEKIDKLNWSIEYHEREIEIDRLELKVFTQKLTELELTAL